MKKIIALLLISNAFLAFIQAQNTEFSDKDRAEYLLDISKYLTWPNETSISKFEIAVYNGESGLITELEKRAAIVKLMKGKEIVIKNIFLLDDLNGIQLLYLNKNSDVDLRPLLTRIHLKNILLVSEGYAYHESMINFLVVNNERHFEINEHRIVSEGFKYSKLFSALAVKSKEDWEKLFYKTDDELGKEKEVVAIQKLEIEQQLERILIQRKEIEQQQNEIDKQKIEISFQRKELTQLLKEVGVQERNLQEKMKLLDFKNSLIVDKQLEIEKQNEINRKGDIEIRDKQKMIGNLNQTIFDQLLQLKLQKIVLLLSLFVIIIVSAFGFYIYRSFKEKQRLNHILEEQNIKIQKQHDEVIEQRDEIARQNKEITDSIMYAKRIQSALLPTADTLKKDITDMFILYRPRDIVSGDYYWMSSQQGKTIIVAADCTGHGVPGAFMSMLGVAFLNEIVNQNGVIYANEILNNLREYVIHSLKQSGHHLAVKDGMDIALCIIDQPSMTLQYAGAYNPLYMVRRGELKEIKADKMPIAYFDHGQASFTNYLIPIEKNDCVYMFSDGYADQFGGPKSKKLGYKKLREVFLKYHNENMASQKAALEKELDDWQLGEDQVDDILVVGIRI